MNKPMKSILSLAAAVTLMTTAVGAFAETISFEGKVTAASTYELEAPLGGSVERLNLAVGQSVNAGDVAATLRTTKYYAGQDGEITAVFAQTGNDAAAVTSRYGAAIYLEGGVRFTINASLSNAYSTIENTYVHAGQIVYLAGKNNTDHVGTGIITVLDSGSYTVEVTEGDFIVGESVNVYRENTLRDAVRIGRGNVARRLPEMTAGEGTIVNLAVKAGQTVKRGDLLMETLTGTAADLTVNGNSITVGVDGVVAEVKVKQGDAVTADMAIATIYPNDAMQIEGLVSESELANVKVGSKVHVTLSWNEDDEVSYDGEIVMISAVPDASTEETSYNVTVTFMPDANTRYGMNATVFVTTGDDEV